MKLKMHPVYKFVIYFAVALVVNIFVMSISSRFVAAFILAAVIAFAAVKDER